MLARTVSARGLLRIAYAPLLLVGCNGAALAVVSFGGGAGWLPALFAVAVASSFAAERILPCSADWNRPRGDALHDWAHAFFNEVLNAATPLHRFHHVRDARTGNVNFGLFTVPGDRLLETLVWDPARRFVHGDLGLADRDDYPRGYLAQLAEPFRSRGDTHDTRDRLRGQGNRAHHPTDGVPR